MTPDRLQIFGGCEHPVRFWNRNTHQFDYGRCGKCTSCINAAASKQSLRVRNEIMQHKYSLMFTLTYDNEHIPEFEVIADKNGVMQLRPCGRAEYLFDSCPLNHRKPDGSFEFEDDLFLPRIENAPPSLRFGVCCKADIQNFMKRLRLKIDKLNLPKNEKRIRYYIAWEYGPKTFRPHYHGVLFFDSPALLNKISDFIVKSWGRFERQDGKFNSFSFRPFATSVLTSGYIKLCDANTSFYVAEYVAGNLGLPRVLRQRETKPFHLQSKSPVIGCYKDSRKTVLENIASGTYKVDQYRFDERTGTGEVVAIPLSKDVCSSLFRKCFQFSDLSFSAKFDTYSFYSRHFPEWFEFINSQIKVYAYENGFKDSEFSINSYLRVCPYDSFRSWCSRCYPDEYSRLAMEKDQTWYASKNAYRVCKSFDLSKTYPYVDSIHAYLMYFDRYLYLRAQSQLADFYALFNEMVDYVGFHTAMFAAYPFLLDDVPKVDRKQILPAQRHLIGPVKPGERVLIDEMSNFDSYYYFGRLSDRKLLKRSFWNSSYFQTYCLQQKKRLDKRNKSKKINNSFIGGQRRIY